MKLREEARKWGINTGAITRELGFTRQYGYAVLAGKRFNAKITTAIWNAVENKKKELHEGNYETTPTPTSTQGIDL